MSKITALLTIDGRLSQDRYTVLMLPFLPISFGLSYAVSVYSELVGGFFFSLLALPIWPIVIQMTHNFDQNGEAQALLAVSIIAPPLWFLGSWMSLALQIKRLHDIGRSGIWAAAPMVIFLATLTMANRWIAPTVVVFFCTVLLVIPGQLTDNRYGPRHL